MAEIEFQDVTKRYADGFEAVKHLNLDVPDGELMILVGPSGCGKSTALRMVAGLEDISDGELKIGGQVVNERAPKDRDIAMVFQNYALYPHMTVRENMGFALKLAKTPQRRDRQQGQRGGEDPRPRAAPRPQAGQPVRRPAPARRDGTRDRPQPERVPDGRAAVEPRRQASRADADRDLPDPAAARDDHDLRHPRPDRGDDARRPDRGDARRRAAAGRAAVGALRPPEQPVRRRLHRLAVDELPARRDRRRHDSSSRSATSGSRTSSAAGSNQAPAAGRRGVVAGLRPEHFEDASLVADRSTGTTFKAKIDVLESMGSEFYAYFVVESEHVSSSELEELAAGRRRRRPAAHPGRSPGDRAAGGREPGQPGRRGRAVVRLQAPAAVRPRVRPQPAGRQRRRSPQTAARDHSLRVASPSASSRTHAGAAFHRPSRSGRATRLPARAPARDGRQADRAGCAASPTTSA